MREFTHVGAYMSAPWFDPLSEQLLILPVSTVAQLGIQSVTYGRVLVPPGSKSTVDSIATHANGDQCGDSTPPLTDWFVYELPRSPAVPNDTSVVACRSMDPHGVWREGMLECTCGRWLQLARRRSVLAVMCGFSTHCLMCVVADKKLVVDAETYSKVQWRRVPPDAVGGAPADVEESAAAVNPRASSTGKRRRDDSSAGEGEPSVCTHSAVAAQEINEADPGTATSEGGGVTVRSATAPQKDSADIKLTTKTPGAGTRNRSALIAKLTSRLRRLTEEYPRQVTTVRQKEASLGFLRSLLMSRTSPAGVRQVPPPLALKGKLGVSYFLNVEPHFVRTDPHLRELRSKLGGGTGSSALHSAMGDLGAPINAVEDSSESKCALQLRSLHYRCVPHTTHVEVSAVVHNPSTSCEVYHVHLAAYSAVAHSSVHCVSGRADTLKPDHTVCIRALLRVPQSVFVSEGGPSLSLKVVLSYRVIHEDCAEISLNNNTSAKEAPDFSRCR
jgi:hypothetical protein